MELSPEELDGCDALFGRPGQPIFERRPLAPLFIERGDAQDPRQPELHLQPTIQSAI